jgi:prepilin-type N-terminal cleavage/methylation domain-containing protein
MTRAEARDDSGVTMIELVVSMTIMAVVMTIFTTAVLQMYQAAHKTESLSNAQSELNTVFLRMDRMVRYASGISDVKRSGTTYYVGVATVEADRPLCNALRLLGDPEHRLQIVTWDEQRINDPGYKKPAWTTLANDVIAPDDVPPFAFVKADANYNFDRLQLNLDALVGLNANKTRAETRIRFTALNTSLTTSASTVCDRYLGTP